MIGADENWNADRVAALVDLLDDLRQGASAVGWQVATGEFVPAVEEYLAENPYDVAVTRFVADMPELKGMLEEHLHLNEELLHTVFLDNVAREFARDVARARDIETAARLGAALETMAKTPDADHPDADVANMIQVTFIESFVWGDRKDHRLYQWLSQFLGPRMLALTREYIEIYPDEASSFVAKYPHWRSRSA